MINVALSHDVDRIKKTYQYFTHAARAIAKIDLKMLNYQVNSIFKQEEPYWQFPKIIEIEQKFDVKSTFYILNESMRFRIRDFRDWQLSQGRYDIDEPNLVEVIRWLDKNGWEIGVHGSYYSYKEKDLLLNEKNKLESLLGHKIIGTRQHYLNIDRFTWEIQKEVGFEYDSTWGFTDAVGFKHGMVKPFTPFNDKFTVFPMSIMDSCFMDEKDRWEKFDKIVNVVDKHNSLLVINWHHRVFNENEFPGYSENYIRVIEELKKMGAKFYTIGEYFSKFH